MLPTNEETTEEEINPWEEFLDSTADSISRIEEWLSEAERILEDEEAQVRTKELERCSKQTCHLCMEGLEKLSTDEIRLTSIMIAPDQGRSQQCQLCNVTIRPPIYHPVELHRFDWTLVLHPCYRDPEGILRSRHFNTLGVTADGLIITTTDEEGNKVEYIQL